MEHIYIFVFNLIRTWFNFIDSIKIDLFNVIDVRILVMAAGRCFPTLPCNKQMGFDSVIETNQTHTNKDRSHFLTNLFG